MYRLSIIVGLCFVAGITWGKTVFVATDGSAIPPYNNWTTAANDIQVAVNTTVSGDTVIVNDGIYSPSAEIVVSNNITVATLNGADSTTVSGGTTHRCFKLLDPGCEVSGFTITKGYSASNGGGVYCNNLNATISNCKIFKNISNANGGGLYNGVANNCLVTHNTASLNGGAASGSYLNNCSVSKNYAFGRGGGMSYGRVRNCIVWYNEAMGAGDNFNSNHTATAYSCSPELVDGVDSCITNNPQFSDVENGNLHLLRTSSCYNTGNNSYTEGNSDFDGNTRIVGGTVDMGAYELADNSVHAGSPIHYVSMTGASVWPYTSWSTAARTIQDAVDVSEAGDTVRVNDGFYNGGGAHSPYNYALNRIFVDKTITIESVNGPENTIVTGAADPIDAVGEAAIRCAYFSSNVVFSGFTVSNGYSKTYGGGIYCSEYSSLISNCVVAGNYSYNHAGGVCRGTITGSVISNNFAYFNGGGLYRSVTSDSIINFNSGTDGGGIYYGSTSNCTFHGNSGHKGGGTYYTTVSDCVLNCNTSYYGGAVYGGTINDSLVVSNLCYLNGGGMSGGIATGCEFIDNVAYVNGGSFSGSTANNCYISDNKANEYGGGVFNGTANNCVINGNWAYYDGGGAATSILNNCTVVDNSASRSGGGISGGEVRNSIIWDNKASVSGNNFNGSLATTVYSCSPDLTSGVNGCITAYPQFSDLTSGNYRLFSSSPCRDIGNNTYTPSGNDLDENTRTIGGTVDLGSYELADNPVHSGSPTHYVSTTGTAVWPYTNWVTAARTIQDAVDVSANGDTVRVNNGFYNGGGASSNGLNRVLANKSIAIESVNGAEHTTITGATGTNKFGEASVRCVSLTGNSTIKGFTLTDGYGSSGGGVLCESVSNIVSDCIITGNSAEDFGGGMRYGTLNNSLVNNNESTLNGGGIDHVTANNSIISNNLSKVDGGGAAFGTVNDCIITRNTSRNNGGGMTAGTANRSVIVDNFSTFVGGGTCVVTANNCLITDNISLKKGGGMWGGEAHNCVIYGNASNDDGGGVYDLTHVKNSIILANTGPYYQNISTCSDVTYSCSTAPDIAGGVDGCITNDPMFVIAGTDFHLQTNSPCIDAGSATGLADDLDGISRPLDGDADGHSYIDMGTYEFSNPAADSDGDNASDYEELVADTDAVDSDNYFQVTAVSNGLSATVYFESSSDRIYTLQGCTNILNATWHDISEEVDKQGNGETYSMHDTNSSSNKYYRIVVKIP